MDPEAALQAAREEAEAIIRLVDDAEKEEGPEGEDFSTMSRERLIRLAEEANDLVGHFQALDGWLKSGGFLPNDWNTVHRQGDVKE